MANWLLDACQQQLVKSYRKHHNKEKVYGDSYRIACVLHVPHDAIYSKELRDMCVSEDPSGLSIFERMWPY